MKTHPNAASIFELKWLCLLPVFGAIALFAGCHKPSKTAQSTSAAKVEPDSPLESRIPITRAAALAEQYLRDKNLSGKFTVNEIGVGRANGVPVKYIVFLRPMAQGTQAGPSSHPRHVLYVSMEGNVTPGEITIRRRQQ